MPISQAKREVNHLLKAGYEHFSREYERLLIKSFLLEDDLPDFSAFPPGQYFLADQPLRSAKNMGVCMVVMMCRFAQDNGADDRLCYAFSDAYINIIEEKDSLDQIMALFNEILIDYRELIQQSRQKSYSLPIQRALSLINDHLYQPCSLARIAKELHLHPSYLSGLFKQEVGMTITQYIRDQKMREARDLIINTNHSVSEIAQMLGYSSVSYFSKVFHHANQTSPRNFALTGTIE